MREILTYKEESDDSFKSEEAIFCEFINLVKWNIEDTLLEKFWSIFNVELINKDYNFTNWVFRFDKWAETFVLKTNYGNRSIRSNFRWFLEDRQNFENIVNKKECSSLIKKQFDDYRLLNELWINTIEDSQVQLIDNFLLVPYLEWEDLWLIISDNKNYSDEEKNQMFISLKNMINSLDKLYMRWLVFWDLKVDNIFIKDGEALLIDPQIKEGVIEDDIWKLIFSILLICHEIRDTYRYDEFKWFFLKILWYSPHTFKTYRNHWYDIYKFLINLEYPRNSKEVIMMQKFYQHLLKVYKWRKNILFTQHKEDS